MSIMVEPLKRRLPLTVPVHLPDAPVSPLEQPLRSLLTATVCLPDESAAATTRRRKRSFKRSLKRLVAPYALAACDFVEVTVEA
ncbi:MAG: hypothetical protein EB084_25655, partial [Proteobacteria bacterium]|nr:hypothetical protein [Pseudomonadota bacterium]